jgi:hypothetical protein
MFFTQRPIAPVPIDTNTPMASRLDKTYPDTVLYQLEHTDLIGISAVHLHARAADREFKTPNTPSVRAEKRLSKRTSVAATQTAATDGEVFNFHHGDDDDELPREAAPQAPEPFMNRFNALRTAMDGLGVTPATPSTVAISNPSTPITAPPQAPLSSFGANAGPGQSMGGEFLTSSLLQQQVQQGTGRPSLNPNSQAATPVGSIGRRRGRKPRAPNPVDQLISSTASRKRGPESRKND